MKWLGDDAISRLQRAAEFPVSGADLGIDRYEIVEKIGQGGMGVVYLARDLTLDRTVALKLLQVPKPTPDFRERMMREARILARLEHPGIVPVHDVGQLADGRVYYAMKRVQGRGLDEHFAEVPDVAAFLRVFERICEAVAFAHAHGVIHRDLKPQNIMVGRFGEVLVMDWGVAKLMEAADPGATILLPAGGETPEPMVEAGQTHPGTILGTPGYMAPEQARGEVDRIAAWSDVYSLGVILGEFLEKAEKRPPRRLRAVRDKATHGLPAQRYRDAEELAADIGRYLSGHAVSAHRETLWERAGRVAYRYRTPILLVLAYLIMRVLLLIFADV